jgi:hypothetical protein
VITFGLDISHHQDLALNLAQARRDGCEFAFLKATEGATFTDSEFAANLAEARAAGMLVAAYVYQRSGASAAAHVERVKAVVPRDVPIIPDVESGSGSLALTRDMINGLRAAGYKVPLLYLPRWYWQQIGSPSLGGLPPLWSSRYPNNVVGTLADEWADVPAYYWDGYGGLSVAVLQFTSSARIAGHQPLDANAYRGDRNQLAALLGGQPDGGDMPLSGNDFKYLLYDNSIQDYGNLSQLLGEIKDKSRAAAGLASAIQNLTNLVIANDANDVTDESLAAALHGFMTSDIAPIVREAVAAALDDFEGADAEEIADKILNKLAAKIAA